jgi:prophage tail gpP-like protein
MTALGTRLLTVSIGGTDYTAEVFDCQIVSRAADSDQTTFAEAAAGGGRIYSLKFVMTQDLATTALWDKIWSAAGTTVAALVKPYGNAAASAAQPHYSGNVVVTEPDGTLIGGAADASTTARWTVEVTWDFTAKPTKVTT